MISRDEAIKIIADYEINGCGYCHQGGEEVEEAVAMAIEALKAQEPIKPKREIRGCGFRWFCGNCGVSIEPNHMYCRICGKPVKWDD